MKATVIIPTMRRPQSLLRALTSLANLSDLEQIEEVIVVDNDPLASANSVTQTFAEEAQFPVRWVHEPSPGVANARNTGVAAAKDARFIAFLDDDETVHPQWLGALLDTQRITQADVVFGPIAGRAPDAKPDIRAFVESFFSREGPSDSGVIDRAYGCGNSLLRRVTTLNDPVPFSVTANELGGEDDILFASLKAKGCVFAWAAEAWVDEHAPEHRANLSYIAKRAFAFGQGPTQTAAENKDWLSVVRWMAIGLGQMAIYGALALVAKGTRSDRYAQWLRKAIEGCGKVFWFRGLEPKLYGLSELSKR